MADVLFLAIMLALFGASVLFIHVCDRIIGPDDDVVIGVSSDESDDPEGALAA